MLSSLLDKVLDTRVGYELRAGRNRVNLLVLEFQCHLLDAIITHPTKALNLCDEQSISSPTLYCLY